MLQSVFLSCIVLINKSNKQQKNFLKNFKKSIDLEKTTWYNGFNKSNRQHDNKKLLKNFKKVLTWIKVNDTMDLTSKESTLTIT